MGWIYAPLLPSAQQLAGAAITLAVANAAHANAAQNVWMFNESLQPNGVSLTHLSGAYTNITDNPSSPDANWLTVS
jgi:hypothetical protein